MIGADSIALGPMAQSSSEWPHWKVAQDINFESREKEGYNYAGTRGFFLRAAELGLIEMAKFAEEQADGQPDYVKKY